MRLQNEIPEKIPYYIYLNFIFNERFSLMLKHLILGFGQYLLHCFENL